MNRQAYRILELPDLTMAKYAAEENSEVEDVLKQQALFYRQLNRRGLLFNESYRFVATYRPEKNPGNRIHIWFEVVGAPDTSMPLTKQLEALPLSTYYNFVPFEDDGLKIEELNAWDDSNPDELVSLPCTAWVVKQSGELVSGNAQSFSGLYIVDEWKMNDKARLIGLFKLMKALNQPCRYVVEIFPCDYSKKVRQDFEFQMQWIRTYVNGLDRNHKDESAEYVLKCYSKYIDSLRSSPHFACRISASSNSMVISKMLLDVVASECVEEGGYEIIETDNLDDAKAPQGMAWWRRVFSLNEIAPFMTFPVLYPGEIIDIPKESAPDLKKREGVDYIRLGNEVLSDPNEGYDVWLELKQLSKHAFLSGVPGSGKTGSMKHLIFQLAEKNIPFLVLEPAKKEYRAIAGNLNESLCDVTVYSPGGLGSFMLRINPFEFPVGMLLSEHMTNLMQVFEGAFDLEAPFPMLLIEGIEEVYRKAGWFPEDVNRGQHDYPTMSMLYEELAVVLENKYAGEVKENLRSVMEVRIGSLLRGEMGNVFDVHESTIKPEEWTERKCIVELEALGKDGANFLTLLLCTLIREHLRLHPKFDGDLRHVIFIEEAHNVIGPSTIPTGETGNSKTASTQFIVDMLAEVRALKEGIVIADQLPTALAEQVTKNTAIKIAHKMTAMDDRQVLGTTMSMDTVQMEQMAFLELGRAFCIYDGVKKPFEIKIENCEATEGMPKESPENEELFRLLYRRRNYQADMLKDWDIISRKLMEKFDTNVLQLNRLLEEFGNIEAEASESNQKRAEQKKQSVLDQIEKVLNGLQECALSIGNYLERNIVIVRDQVCHQEVRDFWDGIIEKEIKILTSIVGKKGVTKGLKKRSQQERCNAISQFNDMYDEQTKRVRKILKEYSTYEI